jgi:hypothetical protein
VVNDERRLAFVRQCVNGRGGVRWRGLAPTASELGALSYSLRRACVFTSDDHSTGRVEYRGKRIDFKVAADVLIVTKTDEVMEPRSVKHMRALAALEQERRAAERAASTQRHRRWKW